MERARIDLDSTLFPLLGRRLAALAAQGVLVKQVLGHLVGVGIHAGEIGDVVAQLLDGLHLLVQVVALQEVAQLLRESKRGESKIPIKVLKVQICNAQAVWGKKKTRPKQLTWGSPCSEASLCRSSRAWFTLFSSASAHCMASSPLPHSSRSGF